MSASHGETDLPSQRDEAGIGVELHERWLAYHQELVTKGDPAARVSDIENVEIVFKDGVGYDTARLHASAKGRYGEY
jgi:hypothetical protein